MKKILFLTAIAFVTLNSCKKEKDSKTFFGPETAMGAGTARSWITITHDEVPLEIGVEMTDEVLSALAKANFTVAIPLHVKAKETTPFDHLYITWAANGHPLPGTFIGPHFDVRFFMTRQEDHLAIPAPPAPGFTNLPPAGYMPVSYFPDAPIPQLGLHWTDKMFDNPVTKAMILGSYDGKFTFVSPIMILPVLQSGESFSGAYAQPQFFARHNWYPTKYNIYMNTATHKHYVTLSDFVWR
ncbi:MAG: hypothetical protein ABJA37_10375 [Ferruginibacter sp.]